MPAPEAKKVNSGRILEIAEELMNEAGTQAVRECVDDGDTGRASALLLGVIDRAVAEGDMNVDDAEKLFRDLDLSPEDRQFARTGERGKKLS